MQQQRRRSGIIIGLLSLGLLTGAALTAGPAQADSGLGPYYAVPAWDQKIAPATRFVIMTNWSSAAVLDKETGLVWEKSPSLNSYTWVAARFACADKTVGNRKGWRLPSFPELASLVDPANSDPSLPTGHPFTNVQLSSYWSATAFAEPPTSAFTVHFVNGIVGSNSKTGGSLVWCVRGAMNADAY